MGIIVIYDTGTIKTIDEEKIYIPVFQEPKKGEESHPPIILQTDN